MKKTMSDDIARVYRDPWATAVPYDAAMDGVWGNTGVLLGVHSGICYRGFDSALMDDRRVQLKFIEAFYTRISGFPDPLNKKESEHPDQFLCGAVGHMIVEDVHLASYGVLAYVSSPDAYDGIIVLGMTLVGRVYRDRKPDRPVERRIHLVCGRHNFAYGSANVNFGLGTRLLYYVVHYYETERLVLQAAFLKLIPYYMHVGFQIRLAHGKRPNKPNQLVEDRGSIATLTRQLRNERANPDAKETAVDNWFKRRGGFNRNTYYRTKEDKGGWLYDMELVQPGVCVEPGGGNDSTLKLEETLHGVLFMIPVHFTVLEYERAYNEGGAGNNIAIADAEKRATAAAPMLLHPPANIDLADDDDVPVVIVSPKRQRAQVPVWSVVADENTAILDKLVDAMQLLHANKTARHELAVANARDVAVLAVIRERMQSKGKDDDDEDDRYTHVKCMVCGVVH